MLNSVTHKCDICVLHMCDTFHYDLTRLVANWLYSSYIPIQKQGFLFNVNSCVCGQPQMYHPQSVHRS